MFYCTEAPQVLYDRTGQCWWSVSIPVARTPGTKSGPTQRRPPAPHRRASARRVPSPSSAGDSSVAPCADRCDPPTQTSVSRVGRAMCAQIWPEPGACASPRSRSTLPASPPARRATCRWRFQQCWWRRVRHTHAGGAAARRPPRRGCR